MQNKLTKVFLLMVLVFLGASLYAQEKLTISGYIKNVASGEFSSLIKIMLGKKTLHTIMNDSLIQRHQKNFQKSLLIIRK